MLLDDARTPFGVAPRLPWRWLYHHVDPAIGGDGEKAEAQESTELLHARVVLPAAPPLGGADSEPDLVADGRAINGLKHQFEREALLHLADHLFSSSPGVASGRGDFRPRRQRAKPRGLLNSGRFGLPSYARSEGTALGGYTPIERRDERAQYARMRSPALWEHCATSGRSRGAQESGRSVPDVGKCAWSDFRVRRRSPSVGALA